MSQTRAARRGGRVISAIRHNAFAAAVAAVALLVMGWLGLYGWAWTDWDAEARPAVDALLAGHVSQFLTLAPVYGGSLILRAPFAFLTKLWHGHELAIYRASAAPCLAASGVLGVWLVARMRAAGASTLARAVALMLCIANPLTLSALEIGHPEELLGAVLCVAAVLCAMHDRPTWAAVLLGLAIPNKEWAVLAVGPMLVALQRGRVRALVITGAVASVLLAPFMLAPTLTSASSSGAASAAASAVNTGAIFQPWQIWWFLGSHGHVVRGLNGNIKPGFRTPPGWIESVGHPLIVAIMVPLTGLYAGLRRRRAGRLPNAPLLLLALLLALRCVLDPWDISYYSLPFLLTLLAWETLSFNRAPVLSLLAALAASVIFQQVPDLPIVLSPDMAALVFALVSVPSIIALSLALYLPGVGRLLRSRPRRDTVTAATGWLHTSTQNAGAGT
ncbi:MAG TPA: hypothetical protein VHW96_24290 [Solirubrobacteraceae bacterium]|jgi:hypothetical protein|nr:hypothetical protein [Solirubrobacteraceae bacterium]